MPVQRTSREGRTLRWLVVVPIVGAVLDDVAYVVLIASQSEHPPDIFTVPFVAVFIALMAAMLALSLAGSPLVVTLRPALRAGAAAGLIVLGVLGAFSIGLPLLIAGFLATGAAIRTLVGGGLPAVASEVAAAVLAVALLVVGFEVTARLIVCPPDGSSSGGSWPGIVTHGFTWECSGGRLHSS
jgi:hypothetical protein